LFTIKKILNIYNKYEVIACSTSKNKQGGSIMDQQAHPMNHPDALIARFQFLRIPHGDGLDMNEPSYNQRIKNHISSYSLYNIINIVEDPENTFLRDNLFVIPFIYARYNVVPSSDDIIDYFRSILDKHKDSDNEMFQYFIENFDDVITQKIPDVPNNRISGITWFGAIVISLILWAIIFSIF
jgi:hypothetical protein